MRIIEEVLQDFEISTMQVMSVVTDNASNMVCGINQIVEEMQLDMIECDPDVNTDNMFGTHVRCAAHGLQLAVKDAIVASSHTEIIAKARSVVVAARTPRIRSILVRMGKNHPIKDINTRWGSTYEMLDRLLDLKEPLVEIGLRETSLSEREWVEVEGLRDSLLPAYTLGKGVQTSELTPGKFYSMWMTTISNLRNKNTTFSNLLAETIRRRGRPLFTNNMLLAGIYVDPNYRLGLSEDERNIGRETFLNVAVNLKRLKEKEKQQVVPVVIALDDEDETQNPFSEDLWSSECPETTPSTSAMSERSEPFEAYLHEQQSTLTVDSVTKQFLVPYVNTMESFRREKIPVMEVIPSFPVEVQEAAEAITAFPATQVSVERLFSALKFYASDNRASMKEDLLEAILFLKTNGYKLSV